MMLRTSRHLLAVTGAVALLACGGGSGAAGAAAAASNAVDLGVPALTATDATATTITVQVCAAETGAPGGFSIQWTPGDDPSAAWPESACGASFSGSARDSRYALAAGECVEVMLGDFLADNGFSAGEGCGVPLTCGTSYLVRTFAHASGGDYKKSDFSTPIVAATAACEPEACTLTWGYWKTHPEVWTVAELTLGETTYAADAVQAILATDVGGNGLLALAHQLVAAKLNGVAGASTEAGDQAIADADALIAGLVIPPLGDGWLAPADTDALVTALTALNQGEAGLPHCD